MYTEKKYSLPWTVEDRTIRIWRPSNVPHSKPLPVVYTYDGQNMFFDKDAAFGVSWNIGKAVEQLSSPVMVVGIDCPTTRGGRFNEYSPFVNRKIGQERLEDSDVIGGGGVDLANWLVTFLKPEIDKEYATIENDTSILGSSMGGLMSLYTIGTYPTVFTRAFCFSTAFWFAPLQAEEWIKTTDWNKVKKVYMDVGEKEDTPIATDEDYTYWNDLFMPIIKGGTEEFLYVKDPEGKHHESSWSSRVGKALRWGFESD